jgi:nucleotide-binding universal stress UspA family protein
MMKILLAVDGSECSIAAVEEAARTPWPVGSVVRIISVAELSTPTPPGVQSLTDGSYGELERMLEDRAVAYISQAMNRFNEIALARTEATAKTLKGDPKNAILDEAEHWDADLIIVGDHGYGAIKRLWLGSVSRAIASHATCSVQIARPRQRSERSGNPIRILLATDGSEFSNAAAREIAGRPWPEGSEVRVISTVHLPFTPTPETWGLPECEYSQLEKGARRQAETAVSQAVMRLEESNTQRESALKISKEILLGHPEEIILESAKNWGADLVVVGSHGRHGIQRFLLGSASQAVASHAPCSVEIVRKPPLPTV